MRKDEKERKTNFSLEFCSQSSRVRKFRKNSKNIQKIKKLNSDIISIQNGLRQVGKEKKKKTYS